MTAFWYHRSLMCPYLTGRRFAETGCRRGSPCPGTPARDARPLVKRPRVVPDGSEARGDPGEVPVVLRDATAVGDHTATGAAAVAVDRPEREPRQALRLRVVTDLGPDRHCGELLLVGQTVHARDAQPGVRLSVGVPERRLDGVLQAFGGVDG